MSAVWVAIDELRMRVAALEDGPDSEVSAEETINRVFVKESLREPEQPAGLSEPLDTESTNYGEQLAFKRGVIAERKRQAPPAEARVCEYTHIKKSGSDRMYNTTCQGGIACYFPVGWIKDYCCYCGGEIAQQEVSND